MKVTNATRSVINYGNRAYGPNASFEVREADQKAKWLERMLGDGRLSVSITAAAKPASHGLTVDEIKAALAAKNVAFDTKAGKADLAALLDAAA